MSTQRYTPEFKEEAVRQVVERGYPVPEVAARLGVSAHSLYKWVKAVMPTKDEKQSAELVEAKSEILRLRSQMRRLEEERDLLKKAAVDSTSQRNSSDLMALSRRSDAKNWKDWVVCAAEKRIMGPLERWAIAV